MHPGGGNIYPPTGQAPNRWESSRILPHLHDLPPRGEPLAKFEPQPMHIWGYPWKIFSHRGGVPRSYPRRHTPEGGGVYQQTAQGGGLEARLWGQTPQLLLTPYPPMPPPHLHLQEGEPTNGHTHLVLHLPHLHLQAGGPTNGAEATQHMHPLHHS